MAFGYTNASNVLPTSVLKSHKYAFYKVKSWLSCCHYKKGKLINPATHKSTNERTSNNIIIVTLYIKYHFHIFFIIIFFEFGFDYCNVRIEACCGCIVLSPSLILLLSSSVAAINDLSEGREKSFDSVNNR